jgi:hypothetical protein
MHPWNQTKPFCAAQAVKLISAADAKLAAELRKIAGTR